MRPSRRDFFPIVIAICAVALLGACQTTPPEDQTEPHLTGGTDIERGRYLVIVAGCNDCHTDGYLMNDGDVPEDLWLLGSPVGWRGPWGTTYPPNLRLTVLTEDQWVEQIHTRTALPPMPWMNLNQLAESDARVLFRYIASLGPAGEAMPVPLPSDVEPTTPYLSLMPVVPGG